jgi:DNA-binding XRE family transcriptional regulator
MYASEVKASMPSTAGHTEPMRYKSAETLARNIAKLQQESGLSQSMAGKKASVDQRTIGRAGRGVVNCTLQTLDGIAEAFGTTPADLLTPGLGRSRLPESELRGYEGHLVMLYRRADESKRMAILKCAESGAEALPEPASLEEAGFSPDAVDLAEAFQALPVRSPAEERRRRQVYAILMATIADPEGALANTLLSRPAAAPTSKRPRGQQKQRD